MKISGDFRDMEMVLDRQIAEIKVRTNGLRELISKGDYKGAYKFAEDTAKMMNSFSENLETYLNEKDLQS